MNDNRKLHLIAFSILIALTIALFVPNGSGRILAAILLLPSAIITILFIKKRLAISIHSNLVLLIVSVIGLLYLLFYYFTIFKFGYTKTGYGLNPNTIFTYTIPIAIIIVTTELIRHVLCVQKKRLITAVAYAICLIADVLICSNISSITNFATFMDVVGLTLFPGIFYNLLFNYLSVRYGFLPNIFYRLLTVWSFYLFPYGSGISYSLLSFFNMLLPIGIYLFINSLFEKKRKYALKKFSRARQVTQNILNVVVLLFAVGIVMLVSNHFKYGALVIATDSMTGELNKGDVAIFESYDDQSLQEGQVIVFERNNSMVVHRIVEIEIINGITRYHTKGDTNEDNDIGYITNREIAGVVNYKLPFFGYPTLWIRSLFRH